MPQHHHLELIASTLKSAARRSQHVIYLQVLFATAFPTGVFAHPVYNASCSILNAVFVSLGDMCPIPGIARARKNRE